MPKKEKNNQTSHQTSLWELQEQQNNQSNDNSNEEEDKNWTNLTNPKLDWLFFWIFTIF